MYRISQVAASTGVPVATLRAWERRYGVISPVRSDSGYRLYDAGCLATINAMRQMLTDGWSPQQAAQELLAAVRVPAEPEPVRTTGQQAAEAAPERSSFAEEFLAAARAMDVERLSSALDGLFSVVSFEVAVDTQLLPALQAMGKFWSVAELTVAAEHLASHAVMRRLGAAFEGAAHDARGPRVLTGLPPECSHEVGILAFATAARRQGLSVLHLGADLPTGEWVDAAVAFGAQAAVISVPTEADVPAAERVVRALQMSHPNLRIFSGGGCQDALASPVVPLGHHIASGARTLAQRLHRSGQGVNP